MYADTSVRDRARERQRGARAIGVCEAYSARKNLERMTRSVLVSVGARVRGSRKHLHSVPGLWLDAPAHGETGLAYDMQYIPTHVYHKYTHMYLHIYIYIDIYTHIYIERET